MDDKILIEDDIIDLTDLLEEGTPPSETSKASTQKKKTAEPDSFDLGKEISMEYDVSVEEIEQDAADLNVDRPQVSGEEVQIKAKEMAEDLSPQKEPLLDIEKEIDLVIQDKIEDAGLTSNEEEMLLKEEPVEGSPPVIEDKPISGESDVQVLTEETGETAEIPEPGLPPVEAETGEAPQNLDASEANAVPDISPAVPETVSSEVISETLISEFKKEMPVLMEGIMRPLVKELLQEIVSATRDALPSLVEKVIREEIEKLKRL
jgi:hypothetical protein